MTTFTNEQKELLMTQTRQALDRAAEGMSTRDIMAHIYAEGLDSKTLEQGQLMADAVLEAVASFDSQYTQAKNDTSAWLDQALESIVKDMTQAERCTCWMKIAAAVTAANEALAGGEEMDRGSILKEIEAMSVTQEEATDALEAELYAHAKEAITESNVMPAVLASQAEALSQVSDGDAAAELLLDFGSRELDFRAVAAMIAYTNVKNGTFSNIPVDMKLEQIATLVCAEVEQARITAAVADGKMTMDTAQLLLNILGVVALVCLLPAVVVLGVAMAESLTFGILALPVAAAGIVLMLYGMDQALQWWCGNTGRMTERASVRIAQLSSGTDKLLTYLRDTLIPQVKERLSAFWQRMKRILSGEISGTAPRREAETAPSEENIVDALEWVSEN